MRKESDYYVKLVQKLGTRRIRELRKLYKILAEKSDLERKLVKEIEKYVDLFENFPYGIFELEASGRILSLNRKMAEILGFSSKPDLIIKSSYSIFDFLAQPEDKSRLIHVLETEKELENFEAEISKKDGEKTWVKFSIWSLTGLGEESIKFYGVCEEILHIKEIEISKNDSPKKFSHKLLRDLATVIFDIRRSVSQITLDVKGDTKKIIDSVLLRCEEAQYILEDIISREDNGILDFELLEPHYILKKMEPFIKKSIPGKVELKIFNSTEKLKVIGDPQQLSRLFYNIMRTLQSLMPSEGNLEVRVFEDKIDDAFIQKHGFGVKGPYAVIELVCRVKSTEGSWLPIFNPLIQIERIIEKKAVDLISIYTTIKQHDGYLVIKESGENVATVRIYLPSKVAYTEEKVNEVKEPLDFAPVRQQILILANSSEVREFVMDALSWTGYEVKEAFNLKDAMAILEENGNISLIIVDVQLLERDCLDLYKKSRKISLAPKFIFLTAYPEEVKEAVPDGAIYEVISKPLSFNVLISKIKDLIG
ncbi:MAG: PAS domain S-box protein [Deltaproteobacteria bacterium]|nr:PAS domain S-box protein [Deltaproteobacteria bacterium]